MPQNKIKLPDVNTSTGTGDFVFATAPTIQTSLNGAYLTASEILITDASKNIVSAPVLTYPSLTELSYVKGLTSPAQTQLGTKQVTIAGTLTDTYVATVVAGVATWAVPSGGGGSNWTIVGSDIYRNSKVRIGSTAAPTERIDIDSDGGWLRVANGDRTGVLLGGGIYFPYTTLSANSRSWAIVNDNNTVGSYGQFAIKYSTTQTGDAKLGTSAFIIDSAGNVGINGTPFNFGSFTYFDVYGKSTTSSGVLRLYTSNSSQGFQGYVSGSTFISTSLGSIPWTFGTNSAERMRLTAGGNFLVGTSTDLGFKFYVAGTTAFQGNVDFRENVVTNMIFGTVTGSKIGTATTQKLAFWNKTPIVQPTTAIASATRVAILGSALMDTDTFDGYTMQQVVRALVNTGILA